MAVALRIRLFGLPGIERDHTVVPLSLPPKTLALLGYLALQPAPVARSHLATLLWGETSDLRSRRNLTHALGQLAVALPDCLQAGRHTLQWAAAAGAWVDVHAFAQLLGPVARGDRGPQAAEHVDALEQGVALYCGELMQGLALRDCPEYETWLIRERERLRQEVTATLITLVRHHAHQQRHERADAYARRLVELDPWHEEGHRAIMLLLAYQGRRAEAVIHYERLQRTLAAELGVTPADDTRSLYERIRDGTWPRDRGGPERQEARSTSAPVMYTATVIRRQLPRAALPFVGRVCELDDLTARLQSPEARLITLVAPGGMGKTRLALAAAERLVQQHAFRDGVAFADLTSSDTAAEIEIALAKALGLPFDSHGAAPRRQLLDYLQSKQLLLLMDSCEQLLGGLAELAAAILHEAPEVVLLATSRERLGLRAEHVLLLDGMDASDDGPALFAANARCGRPDFVLDAQARPLVQAICVRLSGMPLAIELAARWTNTLSLAVISAELACSHQLLISRASDSAERHRSVRAVCAATWARLLPADQAVFAQLAVFRGGATQQAIQAVTGATLWQIQTLVEKALLRFDPRRERYAVHELLRQYAEERLGNDGPGERAARERHAVYFLGALAACEEALKGAQQWVTLAAISAEIENLRAAWRWAAETQTVALMTAATAALSLAYAWLGHHEEGLTAMGLAAEAVRSTVPQTPAAVRATLLTAQARFALLCGDRTRSLDLLEQAEVLLADSERGAATDAAMAAILLERGRSLARQGFTAAQSALTRSKALHKALGDQWGEVTALAELGFLLTNMSHNYGEARTLLEQSVAGYRALGDQIGLSEALMHLCWTNRNIGLFSEALVIAREVYTIAETNGNARLLAQAGSTLGAMLAIGNQYQEAYTTLAAALRLTHELGRKSELPNLYCAQGYVAAFLGHYSEARDTYNHGLRIAQQLGDELERCSLLSGLAGTALAEGAYAEALSLASEALALSDRLGEGYLRSRTLPYRALALRGLGSGDCGRGDALATLRLGLAARSETLVALWVVALLLADSGQLMRAAEVFALSEQQRKLDNIWLQDLALRELRAVIAGLPPQVVAQAQARWAQHDLWSALEELCTELEAKWLL